MKRLRGNPNRFLNCSVSSGDNLLINFERELDFLLFSELTLHLDIGANALVFAVFLVFLEAFLDVFDVAFCLPFCFLAATACSSSSRNGENPEKEPDEFENSSSLGSFIVTVSSSAAIFNQN